MPLQDINAENDRQLQDLADVLFRSHRVVVITGAGISTSCGIPDFRSKDGLYNLMPEQNFPLTPPSSNPTTPSRKRKAYTTDDADTPPSSQESTASVNSRRTSSQTAKLKGQDLFDSRVWKDPLTTATFYQFIASLRQKIRNEVKDPSATHKFIRTLRDGGRLMRCYTQNIDGLESRLGLSMDLTRGKGNKRRFMKKNFEAPLPEQTSNTDFDGGCEVVPLHGDLEQLRCTLCQTTCDWTDEATEIFLEGEAPECDICGRKSNEREATGKRGLSVGSLRPNIVLYGEDHPSNTVLAPLVPFDIASGPEVLIIMGTSLKVYGLQKVVRDFAKAIHSQKEGKGRVIFINRTRPAESIWDGVIDDYVAMDCDDWVRDLHNRRPDLWLRQGDLNLKVTKPAVKRKKKSTEDGEVEEQPTKKQNLVVEIPKRRATKPKVLKKLAILPASPRKSPTLPNILNPGPTPKADRYADFKEKGARHPWQSLLSPLVQAQRPRPSPLGNSSFKCVPGNLADRPGTPSRPPMSPLTPKINPPNPNTPARMMSRLFQELTHDTNDVENQGELEIAESAHEKENLEKAADTGGGMMQSEDMEEPPLEQDGVVETPSRTIRGKTTVSDVGESRRHLPSSLDKLREGLDNLKRNLTTTLYGFDIADLS